MSHIMTENESKQFQELTLILDNFVHACCRLVVVRDFFHISLVDVTACKRFSSACN